MLILTISIEIFYKENTRKATFDHTPTEHNFSLTLLIVFHLENPRKKITIIEMPFFNFKFIEEMQMHKTLFTKVLKKAAKTIKTCLHYFD